MDFHSLTRRELQALCKKNKIPANMTNIAMADALQSLEFVDGIEEILKTCEYDVANSSMESPGKSEALTSVPRTGRRTTQRKTIKHDAETLQTSTRSHCRTRGTVVRDADEAKNDMHETPALPTTRRRAATTSVRAKLESAMKECEPKEKIVDPVEEEKKDVPKTPAAALTSQRKEVKAKSSVRPVYSTRRSVRLAGKPMQESTTQEDEKSGTIAFDAVSEETDESLEVNSELHSAHKTEELDKNDIDLKSSESLDIKNELDTVSGHDSNTLVQNEIDMEDGVQQDSSNDMEVVTLDTKAKEGSEEVALGHNNNGSEEISGEEPMEESEIVAEDKKEKDFQNKSQNLGDDTKNNSDITKQPHGQDELHCGDTSDSVAENNGEAKMRASQQKCVTNMQANIDFLEVNLFEQFNGEVEAKASGKCLTNMEEYEVYHSVDSVADDLEVAGEEEPMEEYDVEVTEANVDAPADSEEVAGQEECEVYHSVDSVAHGLEVAGEEEPVEEHDVKVTEANLDAPADSVEVARQEESMEEYDVADAPEVAGEEEPMEEYDVEVTEANVDAPADSVEVAGQEKCEVYYSVDSVAHGLEVAGEEEPVEEYDVEVTEANLDAPADSVQVARQEETMEEYDVDCTKANVDAPEVAGEEPMEEYDVDCAEANMDAPADSLEVAGDEESTEEFEVDYAKATVESAAHSIPPLPLIPDAAQEGECEVKVSGSQQYLHVSETNTEVAGEEPMEEYGVDHGEVLPPLVSVIPNAPSEPVFILASTNSELITQTTLENSSAVTSIGQILVSDNKENLVCTKENKGTAGNNNEQSLQNLSLRKLTKMLKDLTISKHPSGKESASSRSALQKLPENRLTSENGN